MNYNLFILGYGSSKFLDAWIDPEKFKNTKIRIIDNGNQTYSERLIPYLYYSIPQNIGCAGGWNFICKLAFEFFNLEKAIISNEDNLYSEEYIEALYNNCSPVNISGTYDRAFEFSLFCIHRETYYKVGMFDENVIFAAGEDNDYKYRCKLNGVTISTLGISADYNLSETGGDSIPDIRDLNLEYVNKKWNNYSSDKAHGDEKFNRNPELNISDRLFDKYKVKTFPSLLQYSNFYENILQGK
jgi:hypothetical protein